MAILILQTKKSEIISDLRLKDLYIDGYCGISYVNDSKEMSRMRTKDINSFIKMYKTIHSKFNKNGPINIVLNQKSGDNKINWEPIVINKKISIISEDSFYKNNTEKYLPDKLSQSDIESISSGDWDKVFVKESFMYNLLDSFFSKKVVMIHSDNKHVVFNPSGGIWENGSWFSDTRKNYNSVKNNQNNYSYDCCMCNTSHPYINIITLTEHCVNGAYNCKYVCIKCCKKNINLSKIFKL